MSEELNLAATFRVMPENAEDDLEKLKEKIANAVPEHMKLRLIEEEPIAFGLVALKPVILMSDKVGGNIDPMEDALKAIEGVGEVDIVDVGRLL